MSADLLRRAAAKLREASGAATPGPWVAEHDREAEWFTLRSQATFEFSYQSEIATVHSPDEFWADYDYFALMHPPVALALADLLDAHARLWVASEVEGRKGFAVTELLDVARAVLREDGEPQ